MFLTNFEIYELFNEDLNICNFNAVNIIRGMLTQNNFLNLICLQKF